MAQQTINLGAAPDDGTGDTLRAGGDKINDNFDELYDETLKFKGSTDCSTNPNYPAALKGDAYRVSVAGKIGGASGVDVEVADLYFATADNAGGDQATVGTSWSVLQGNITNYLPLSGGTLTGDLIVPDEAYDATNWDGNLEVPTKNAVRDKIEAISAGSGITVEDEGVSEGTGLTTLNFTGAGVSVTVVGSEAEVIIPGGGGGVDVEDEGVAEATGATILNFAGAGVTATDVGGGQVDVTIPGGGTPSGTSFPGSPSSGDLFRRTDRGGIEYMYDGTRWLSTTLYSMSLETQEASFNPITATSQNFRVTHPFWGIYDIYVEKYIVVMNNSATTAANYFTARLETRDGASSAQLGSGLSGQNDAQNTAVGHSENINSVVASTIEFLLSVHTETGTASVFIAASLTYRLVG